MNVSRICMGCMGFGDPGQGQHAWTLDEAHSREIIRRGLELGVMAQNKPANAKEKHVWTTGNQKIYHNFKPVLFEFPTYEYFVTGDKVGDCGRMNV